MSSSGEDTEQLSSLNGDDDEVDEFSKLDEIDEEADAYERMLADQVQIDRDLEQVSIFVIKNKDILLNLQPNDFFPTSSTSSSSRIAFTTYIYVKHGENVFIYSLPNEVVPPDWDDQMPPDWDDQVPMIVKVSDDFFNSLTKHMVDEKEVYKHVFWKQGQGFDELTLSIIELVYPNFVYFDKFAPTSNNYPDDKDRMQDPEHKKWVANAKRIDPTDMFACLLSMYVSTAKSTESEVIVFDGHKGFAKGMYEFDYITMNINKYLKQHCMPSANILAQLRRKFFGGATVKSADGVAVAMPFNLRAFLRHASRIEVRDRIEDEFTFLVTPDLFDRILDSDIVQRKLRSDTEYNLIQQAISKQKRMSIAEFFDNAPVLNGIFLREIVDTYQDSPASYKDRSDFSAFIRICFALSPPLKE